MNKIFLILLFCLFNKETGYSQELLPLNDSFAFRDGVYFSFLDFLTNNPSESFNEVSINGFEVSNIGLDKNVDFQRFTNNKLKEVSEDSIWGFCKNGHPYLNLANSAIKNQLKTGEISLSNEEKVFVPFLSIGKISFFVIELNKKQITKDSKSKKITSEYHHYVRQMVMDLETGKIYDVNPKNMEKLLSVDPGFADFYKELKYLSNPYDVFRSYNILNPVYPELPTSFARP